MNMSYAIAMTGKGVAYLGVDEVHQGVDTALGRLLDLNRAKEY
jgi:hypothetical protein